MPANLQDYQELIACYAQLPATVSASVSAQLETLCAEPKLTAIRIRLGDTLSEVLLCLIILECTIDKNTFTRLARYQEQDRLQDLVACLTTLSAQQFTINSQLIKIILDKTPAKHSFLPTIKLLGYARQLQLIDASNYKTDERLNKLSIKQLAQYDTLNEGGLLSAEIIQNLNFSGSREQLTPACVELIQIATTTGVITRLNDESKTRTAICSSTLDQTAIVSCCKMLQEKSWLTPNTLLIACKLSTEYHQSLLYMIQGLTTAKGIAWPELIKRIVSDYVSSDKLQLNELIFTLSAIVRANIALTIEIYNQLMTINQQFIKLAGSLSYLLQRTTLNPTTLQAVIEYYRHIEEYQTLQPAKKARTGYQSRSSSSISSFFATSSKPSAVVEPAQAFTILQETDLARYIDQLAIYLNSSLLNFIVQLYYLGELSESRITYAIDAGHYEMSYLEPQLILARSHIHCAALPPHLLTEDQATAAAFATALQTLKANRVEIQAEATRWIQQRPAMLIKLVGWLESQAQYQPDAVNGILAAVMASENPEQAIVSQTIAHLLSWPISTVEVLGEIDDPELFISTVTKLKSAGVAIEPAQQNHWLTTSLTTNALQSTDYELIILLSHHQQLNQTLWQTIATLEDHQKHELLNGLRALATINRCQQPELTLLVAAPNISVAAEVILQFGSADLAAATYWTEITKHPTPSLFAKAILTLHEERLLSDETLQLINTSFRPDLAALAYIKLKKADVVIEHFWEQVIVAENPAEQVELLLTSNLQQQLASAYSPAIQHTIQQHQQPIQALEQVGMLAELEGLSETDIIAILTKANAAQIIEELKLLRESTDLTAPIVNAIIHHTDRAKAIRAYAQQAEADSELLQNICAARDSNSATNLLRLKTLQARFPEQSDQLASTYQVKDSHQRGSYLRALEQLAEAGLLNTASIMRLAQANDTSHVATIMIGLEQAGLHNEDNLRIILNKHHQHIATIAKAVKKAPFTQHFIDAIRLRCGNATEVTCLARFASHSDVSKQHVAWLLDKLGTINHDKKNDFVSLINALLDSKTLSQQLLETMMPYDESSLTDAGKMARYIPIDLLDLDIINMLLNALDICFYDDYQGVDYNPFQHFHNNEARHLLTREVVILILQQDSVTVESVFHSMRTLEAAGIFRADIIQDCSNDKIAKAYAELTKVQLLTSENRQLLRASHAPVASAKLIIELNTRQLHTKPIQDLLLLQEQRQSSARFTLQHYGASITQLLTRCPSMTELSLVLVLTHTSDWPLLNQVIAKLSTDAINETCIRLVVTANLNYLNLFLQYINLGYKQSAASFSDLIRLCQYQEILSSPQVLQQIASAADYRAHDNFDCAKIVEAVERLWPLCATKQIDAIIELLANTKLTAASEQQDIHMQAAKRPGI